MTTALTTEPVRPATVSPPTRRSVFGVRYDDLDRHGAEHAIERFIRSENEERAHLVMFTNVHTIHMALKRPDLAVVAASADLVLPDGSGLALYGRVLGPPLRENLNGTDFTPRLLARAEEQGWSVFLLGSHRHVVERTAETLRRMFPRLRIAGIREGFFGEDSFEGVVETINRHSPDILLVAMGTPLQEIWIWNHRHLLNARVCMAVGGLFDFLSGKRKRAPRWMRALGLEWLFRFMLDPGAKWERVFVEIPVFVGRILIEALRRTMRSTREQLPA